MVKDHISDFGGGRRRGFQEKEESGVWEGVPHPLFFDFLKTVYVPIYNYAFSPGREGAPAEGLRQIFGASFFEGLSSV